MFLVTVAVLALLVGMVSFLEGIQNKISAEPQVTYLTKSVKRGGVARIAIQGKPETFYSITVQYKSGPSTAAGLYSKTSNEDGFVSWSWRVGGNTTRGGMPDCYNGWEKEV